MQQFLADLGLDMPAAYQQHQSDELCGAQQQQLAEPFEYNQKKPSVEQSLANNQQKLDAPDVDKQQKLAEPLVNNQQKSDAPSVDQPLVNNQQKTVA
jgi:hypothetical protein